MSAAAPRGIDAYPVPLPAVLDRVSFVVAGAQKGGTWALRCAPSRNDTAMSEDEKHYLVGVFEDEIRRLERLLGWDCSDWLA